MYVSEGEPSMPPMLLPAKHKHSYTATIRVVVEDQLGATVFVSVQLKVRLGSAMPLTSNIAVDFHVIDECLKQYRKHVTNIHYLRSYTIIFNTAAACITIITINTSATTITNKTTITITMTCSKLNTTATTFNKKAWNI